MNNDVFGLTANGSNGGQAGSQPVSMETIDQIQVNIAPFDVRQDVYKRQRYESAGNQWLCHSVHYQFQG